MDARLASSALRAWLQRHWRYDEHALAAHPFEIRIEEDATLEGSGREAGWQAVEARLPGGESLGGWRRGAEWRFAPGAAVVAAQVDGQGTRIRVRTPREGVRDGDAPPQFLTALYLCITESLRVSGLIPLHAAVVVLGEDAVALAASSGTGKSTTLLRLLERGWHPLAEDLVWLDPGTLRVYGWDRGVRLWSDGVARLPRPWREAAWRVDMDGKRFLPWSEIRPARRPTARLRRIVRLERTARGATTLEPLAPHEAVRTLWETMGVPLIDAARDRAVSAVPALLGRVEFARLGLGSIDDETMQSLGPVRRSTSA